MSDSLLLLGVILAASLIQGTAGFGFGLFSMGILAVMMPVADAAVIVAILGLVTTTVNVYTVRREIPWRELWPVVVTAAPATAVGVYLLATLDPHILRAAVAAMILVGCAVTLWSPRKARLRRAWPWAYISGAVGGVFGGGINMGGPPVVLYSLLRGWDKGVAKALMSSYFFVTSVIRVAGQVVTGIATPALIRQSLLLTAPTLLGCLLGTWLFSRMSNRVFRYLATALLVGLAIRLLF